MEEEKKLARERASIILQVRNGTLTATEGAERLGISRKTYYEWEGRALAAMTEALENHGPANLLSPWMRRRKSFKGKSGIWRRSWIWRSRRSR